MTSSGADSSTAPRPACTTIPMGGAPAIPSSTTRSTPGTFVPPHCGNAWSSSTGASTGCRRRFATGASATGSRTTWTGRCRGSVSGAPHCRCGPTARATSSASARGRSWRRSAGAASATSICTRPAIDEVTFAHPENGREYRRVPEVIDCWFDSGAMPYAQFHYPFENRELVERRSPADYICEAVDQTRGWFYTLHAIATLVSDDISFRNCICLAHLVDEHGKKMSKSLGNILEPETFFEQVGADPLRWYLAARIAPEVQKRISVNAVKDFASLLPEHLLEHLRVLRALRASRSSGLERGRRAPRPPGDRPLGARPAATHHLARDALAGRLRRAGSGPRHRGIRRAPQQLVRAPQPAAILEVERGRGQAGRLPHALRVPRDRHSPDRPRHALSERGGVSEPRAAGRRSSAAQRAHVEMAGDGRRKDRRRARRRLRSGAAHRGARAHRAQRLSGTGAPTPLSPPRTGTHRARRPRGASARRADPGGAEHQDPGDRGLRCRPRHLSGEAQPAAHRKTPRAAGARDPRRARARRCRRYRRRGRTRRVLRPRGRGGDSPFPSPRTCSSRPRPPPATRARKTGGYLVGLDTRLDEPLVLEGLARELVRTVQETRKQAGLEVSDRIALRIEGSARIEAALASYRDYIAAETLASTWPEATSAGAFRAAHRLDEHAWTIWITTASPSPPRP